MATRTKRLRLLNETYADLPMIACKGLCHETCSFILLNEVEVLNIETHLGRKIEVAPMQLTEKSIPAVMLVNDPITETCPFLIEKKCSIYQVRPAICRMFGCADELVCRHGCRPTHSMNRAEGYAILTKIAKL